MEDNVILLGKRTNPYPYFRACDIYVQPSRYEGNPVTVHEALALGKPVVITAFPTAQVVVKDGVDGIVLPMDNDGFAKGLSRFIHEGGGSFHLEAITFRLGCERSIERFYTLV